VDLDALARLAAVADGQFGYVTRAQSAAVTPAGDLRRLIAAGLVEDVTPTVVRIRAGGRHPLPRLFAAWLALDPATPGWERTAPACGVVSHGAAARLWGVGAVPSADPEFTVPEKPKKPEKPEKPAGPEGTAGPEEMAGLEETAGLAGTSGTSGPEDQPGRAGLHVAALAGHEWVERHGLPVTTPARTLADLAAAGRLDGAELGRVAWALLAAGHASEAELAAALDRPDPGETLRQWLDAADQLDG
jgi:hypothetical protein